MLLFYVGLGYLANFTFLNVIQNLVPEYEEPEVNPPLLGLLNAGPFEESLFFGIPFYGFGKIVAVLITGLLWASVHTLNTESPDLTHLAYGNFIFALCYLFFSLRTWISGMGWFSMLAHSVFNGTAFLGICYVDTSSCVLSSATDLFMVGVSLVLVFVTFYLYQRRKYLERKKKSETGLLPTNGSFLFPSRDIECKTCHSPNPNYISFCYKCGAIIAHICSSCNASNSLDSEICAKCGDGLKEPTRFEKIFRKPSRKVAIIIVVVGFASLFLFPIYISYAIIIGMILLSIIRRPKAKRSLIDRS